MSNLAIKTIIDYFEEEQNISMSKANAEYLLSALKEEISQNIFDEVRSITAISLLDDEIEELIRISKL